MEFNVNAMIDRAADIRKMTERPQATIRQRMADAAAELSNAGDNQTRVEILNEACLAMTQLCYETDPDGVFCNIDSRTYRLLIPAPWGRAGWKRWGQLRRWEAGILSQILIVRCQMRRVQPVFDYNAEARTWHCNQSVYTRIDQALLYWKNNPIRLSDWRKFADISRQQAHARMRRARGEL